MKNNLLTLATILTIGLFTNNVTGQTTESSLATAAANAHLVTAMGLTENTQLDFGTILLGTDAIDSFVLAPTAGTAALTGNSTHLVASGGHIATAGKYTVSGSKDSGYTVTLPTTIGISNGEGAALIDNMTITDLKLLFTNAGSGTTSGKLVSGSDIFYLGGTLGIIAGQSEGTYTGDFTVSVDYN